MKFTYLLRAATISLSLLATGCATQVVEQPNPVTPATKNLGSFDRTILVKGEIMPPYAEQGANIKAVNKIDEVLARDLTPVVNALEVMTLEEAEGMDLAGKNTLVIRPVVKQIKFINGGARFFAGSFAGSSVVVMDVKFVDGATGAMLAEPGYYRKASAFGDGFGISDNRMLSAVATDVVNYAMANR